MEFATKDWILVGESLNQTAAQAACKSKGGQLVSINNAAEHKLLYEAFAGTYGGTWIGLMLKAGVGQSTNKTDWVWLRTGQTSEYDGWEAGEPNNNGGGEGQCAMAAFLAPTWTGGWNDLYCATPYEYTCEGE